MQNLCTKSHFCLFVWLFESPEVINTTQGLFRVDYVEIHDCINADGDGVAGENLEAKELENNRTPPPKNI